MKSMRFLAATALATATIFSAGTAWAQTPAPAKPAAADEDASQESIIVTGSRIARPNLESTVPITSVGGEEIFQSGNTSVGDLLNDLPALRSTFSQANSSRFLGTTGLNLLDLRGLGTQRTLVLVNGRRHVGSDILSNAVSPDTNTFPSDLIERIDIVTGGNSAVYGSDAIAGVVNFVLKKNFDGVQVRGQGGVSTYGDNGTFFVSGLAGTNFADGRGNIALNVEYAHQTPYFAFQRPNLAKNSNFVVVDTDPSGSDGVVDRIFVNDIRSVTISNGGLLQFGGGAGAACGRDAAGAAFVCSYLFQSDGSLIRQTGTRVGIAPNGNFDGGNGFSGREGRNFNVYPKLDRYSANLIGHFTISDAFEPFIEAKYVRTDSNRFGSPAFFQGSTIGGGVDLRERPRFDNPFLSDSARATIQAARATAGLAPAGAATRLTLRKNLLDLGGREEVARRETYRIVGGATGTFNDDWKYEFSVNYGEFKEKTKVLGNLDQQRFLLAMDAVRDPSGNIVCRSKIDPAAAQIFPFSNSDAFATSRLANDVSSCVPLNPFGEGNISQASKNYLLQDTTSVGSIKQFVVGANLSGDLSQLFELPGGPVGFNVGLEYRRERNFFQAEELVAQGQTFYNALPLFDPPAFAVKEAYGEVRIPILKDVPFFHELTLSGAGRVSDYKGSAGTVYAYNGGVDWAPIRDIRFRAGYARSVRAPNLSDLYSSQSQNFAPGFGDPCSARNIGTGAATRIANCRAAGIPAAYDFVYAQSLEILSGGNPNLKVETSNSLTVGAVIQPQFVPGLSISVDYYNIKVNNVITAPTAQQIVNACYDAVDLNNQFCALFSRAGAGGAATGESPFQIIEGSLQQTLLNYAKNKVRGLDVEASYKRDLDNLGTLSTRVVYTHLFQNDDFLNPADPGRADQTLLELGDPQDALNWDTEFKRGDLTLGLQFRYIGKQVLNAYEDFFSKQGRPPENADYASVKFYPSVFYQDVRLGFDVNKKFNIYGGVDNVFNRQPPFGLTGTGGGSGIYDARGRFMYVGVKAKL
jgi:outer membrane receptor protein involved in Fe transport